MKKTTGLFNQSRFWALLTGLICVLCISSLAQAFFGGKVENFTADQVTLSPSGEVQSTVNLYVTPEAMRMDGMPGMELQGKKSIDLSILVLKKMKKEYYFNHDKKLYFEDELMEGAMAPGIKALGNVESETVLGKEKVSGYPCVKKEIVTSYEIMGMKRSNRILVWESNRFDMPLRTRTETGHTMEVRNIDPGVPPKELFRRPVGYRRVNSMMAVMGMDFGPKRADAMQQSKKENLPQASLQDMDEEQMMTGLKRALGDNADPEQLAKLQEIMGQALQRAKQTKTGPGSAQGLWQIIPQRPGDHVGEEMKTPDAYNVILGSTATLQQVFNFYQNKLGSQGWADGGMYLRDGKGTMSMNKGQQQLRISWADNPGMQGNYSLFYTINLSGSDS